MAGEIWDDEWTVADSRSAAAAAADGARNETRKLPRFDPGIAERPGAPRPDYLASGARQIEGGEVGASAASQIPVALDRANYGLVPRGLDYMSDFFSPEKVTKSVPMTLLFEPTRFLMECGPQLGSALLTTIQYPGLVHGPRTTDEIATERHNAIITINSANRPSAFGVPTRPLDIPTAIVDDTRLGNTLKMMARPTWMNDTTGARSDEQSDHNTPGRVIGAVITNPQELALASAHTRMLRQLAIVKPPEGHLSELQVWDAVRRPVLTTNDWDWFFDPMITDISFRERVHQLVCTDLRSSVRVPTIYDNSTARERMQLRLAVRLLRIKILSSYEARQGVMVNRFLVGQSTTVVLVVPHRY